MTGCAIHCPGGVFDCALIQTDTNLIPTTSALAPNRSWRPHANHSSPTSASFRTRSRAVMLLRNTDCAPFIAALHRDEWVVLLNVPQHFKYNLIPISKALAQTEVHTLTRFASNYTLPAHNRHRRKHSRTATLSGPRHRSRMLLQSSQTARQPASLRLTPLFL